MVKNINASEEEILLVPASFIVLGHYFPHRFPSFWQNFNTSVLNGEIISVREVYNELKSHGNKPHLDSWIQKYNKIFVIPNVDETEFVGQIFAFKHFQKLISERQRLKGTPVADPFVIAAAKFRSGCVVTEEIKKRMLHEFQMYVITLGFRV